MSATGIAARTLLAVSATVAASPLAGQQTRTWSVAARPELQIGEAEGAEEYMFQAIESAHVLPDGRIVVADGALLEIRIYGRDGKFQQRVGKRGNGPGEFTDIKGMWLTPQGRIAVWDGDNRRITIFNSRGVLETTHNVRADAVGGNLEVFFGAFGNGDVILASLFAGPRGPAEVPDRWVLGRYGLDGTFKGRLGEVRGMWRYNGSPVPFTPLPAVVGLRDSLYVADGYESEISVRDRSGSVRRRIALPRGSTVSVDDAWSAFEASVLERSRSEPTPYVTLTVNHLNQKLIPRPTRIPQIGGFLADDRGNLWVKAYDPHKDMLLLRPGALSPAPGGEWRVVSPSGGVTATVRMPATVRPLEVAGNRLLGVSTDEFGVERLVVHTLQR